MDKEYIAKELVDNKEIDREYEALLDEYEDALMRVVMYRVAREDGKRLLQEAEELERSGFEVPKELDEKCRQLIHATCAPRERRQAPAEVGACENSSPRRLRLHRVGRVLIAAILAAVALFCTAYAANEDFRVNVLNFFLELRENGTWFFFKSKEFGEATPNSLEISSLEGEFPFEFTYIPKGYELLLQETDDMGQNGVNFFCAYGNPQDSLCEFYFEIGAINEGTGLLIDTEDAVVTDVSVRGHDGWLIKKTDSYSQKEKIMYLWFDLERSQMFHYSSLGILSEESQKIFDGIVIYS